MNDLQSGKHGLGSRPPEFTPLPELDALRDDPSTPAFGDPAFDRFCIELWAKQRKMSTHTRKAYLIEARRYLDFLQSQKTPLRLGQANTTIIRSYLELLARAKPIHGRQPKTAVIRRRAEIEPSSEAEQGSRSWASVLRAHAALRSLYRWMQEKDLLLRNPADFLLRTCEIDQAPKEHESAREIVRFLKEHEVKYLVQAGRDWAQNTADPEFYAAQARWMILLLFHCGLRSFEALTTPVSALTLRTRDSSGPQDYDLAVTGKRKIKRKVTVSQPALEAFRAFEAQLPPTRKEEHLKTPILCARNRRPLSYATLYRRIRSFASIAREEASRCGDSDAVKKLDKISPHWLRHSLGTALSDKGVKLQEIQSILGHQNLETTRIYIHENEQRKREAVGMLKDPSTP